MMECLFIFKIFYLFFAVSSNKVYPIKVDNKDLKYFKNLNYLVIDCLRFNKHPSHFNLNEVIELTKLVKPKKQFLPIYIQT